MAWLVVAASLLAANVWESKPYHTWTDGELEKVLTSSPWAGKASVRYVRSRPQPIQEEAMVTWVSARVMRQALTRKEFGPTTDIRKDVEAIIGRTPSRYILTVKISKGAAASHASQADAMLNETFLQVRGKPPIPVEDVEGEVIGKDGKPLSAPEEPTGFRGAGPAGGPSVFASAAQRAGGAGTRGGAPASGGQRGGDGRGGGRAARGRGAFGIPTPDAFALLTFRFPRDAITLDDKEVEFVTKLCGGGFGGLPPFIQGGPPLNFDASPQRGSIGPPGDFGGFPPNPQAAQMPACNYSVKKKFKLLDMVVRGELDL